MDLDTLISQLTEIRDANSGSIDTNVTDVTLNEGSISELPKVLVKTA